LISLDKAKQFVLQGLVALAPAVTPLDEAMGCVIAEEIRATEAVPGFTNSSMDGFAVRAIDTSGGAARLDVVDAVMAGDVSSLRLGEGQAMRIMTGAPLPEGADAVSMIEEVSVEDEGRVVVLSRTVETGEFVRHPGDDVAIGQLLFSPGDEVNATVLAVLAGQGRSLVNVHRRPRVGVISTGNELSESSDALNPGQIRDLNRPLLLALLTQSGFEAVDLGVALDTHEEITRRLRAGVEECDAVVSTGGVSVGDVDHVKTVIGELGGSEARSMQVAIKPAKPFAFGVVGPTRTPVFGLPGNPVSTRVSFELFVRPALRMLAGHSNIERLTVHAVLDVALTRPADGKLHLVHVTARMHNDGMVHVENAARRGSHLLNAIARANAIAYVPEGASSDIGDHVRVVVLDADQLSAST
jgi:molybdenum cofactor synthesis domain-containing protein